MWKIPRKPTKKKKEEKRKTTLLKLISKFSKLDLDILAMNKTIK